MVVGILISVHAGTFAVLYAFMRHTIQIPVAWKSITKYVLSALVMGIALFLLPTTTTLTTTIAKTVAGFGLYAGLLLAIDAQARELVRLIGQEIAGTLRQLTHPDNNSGENCSLTK